MESGIYILENIVNGKKYIGSTKNLYKRHKQHYSLLTRNKSPNIILQRAFNKYGEEAFTFGVLAKCPQEYLFKLEQWFVDNLKPEYNSCLINVSVPIGLSAKVGYTYTDEHREIKRKEAFIKLSTINSFGWKSRVIEKLDNNKEAIKEYSSLKEYASEHNCSIAAVGKALKKNQKCKGFYIRYKQLNIDLL